MSDQDKISSYNINTISSRKVMRLNALELIWVARCSLCETGNIGGPLVRGAENLVKMGSSVTQEEDEKAKDTRLKLISITDLEVDNVPDYGIDWNGPLPDCQWGGNSVLLEDTMSVEVPDIELPSITETYLHACLEQNDPLAESQCLGLDIYLNLVLHFQALGNG
ncbi:hypothetical protein AWC38_SpisGene13300 [Stylophora pistillata]|uniref:Uncharacterized protein n=1 Tax=Stylophora pistillata TaxID=50429 RepID=A0A2B4RZH9_STYPI|nr:hypothetical protein AWC38_SpisGene13300 [Stylophora pistillata]